MLLRNVVYKEKLCYSVVMADIVIGTSSFETLRENNLLYVDKTQYIYSLVKNVGAYYFCSRPRRFGKSLTISTLKALFEGKRELFKGLYIDSTDYTWKKYPVLKLDLASCSPDSAEGLKNWFRKEFKLIADEHNIVIDTKEEPGDIFKGLIHTLSKQ